MRRAARYPRWALSFADLCLLLVAFFVLLHAHGGDPGAVGASMRAAFSGMPAAPTLDHAATDLFEPNEAVFRPDADRDLRAAGRMAARTGRRLVVRSTGADPGTQRFDGWELAAARTAAVARAVRQGGLADDRIDLDMMPGGTIGAQRIAVLAR